MLEFNRIDFIETDPISIPHHFSSKEDIEISAFLTAIIAWGNRKSIISNAEKMLDIMESQPYDFVIHHTEADLRHASGAIHRTFNADDFKSIIMNLKFLYLNHNGLQGLFTHQNGLHAALRDIHQNFFQIESLQRAHKHLPNIDKGSAAKRINMFLRWMVRKDANQVDFGLWNQIDTSELYLPLDVHSGRVARKLGLLTRKQNDWKAVLEVTEKLRALDSKDPIQYDYALFGISAIEKFTQSSI